MDDEKNEREQRERDFARAMEQPHLLVWAEKLVLRVRGSEKTVRGCSWTFNQQNELQAALAKYYKEEKLQELIDFFTGALERSREIREKFPTQIIPFTGESED